MPRIVFLLVVGLAGVLAQQPGKQKDNQHPSLTVEQCTTSGCEAESKLVALDANWLWSHKTGTYQPNCFDNNEWNPALCSDAAACAKGCAIDVAESDYPTTYGVTAEGSKLSLKFKMPGGNVGSRSYLLEPNATSYTMFYLKNREFSFDVDASTLPCGLNGALYFVEMEADGGVGRFAPGNSAGARYGTGYCDAQCGKSVKFINGEANVVNWTAAAGSGGWGSCCSEMDIWEANSMATAVTAHPCTNSATGGATRCEDAATCDDPVTGLCDKAGCDFNTYRNGDTNFFGAGASFTVDSSKPMSVVTQFVTDDGTDNGKLTEVRRFYVQDGKKIEQPKTSVGGGSFDSITDAFCKAQKPAFNDTDGFGPRGGLERVGEAMERGMVLVMSLWDDGAAHMLWLDSDYPLDRDTSKAGVARGPCAKDSGAPDDVRAKHPDATVAFSNIRYGPLGSTYPVAPTPAPAPTPPAPPAPTGQCTGCGYACHGSCSSCGRCNMKPGCQSESQCMGTCNSGNNAMWCGGGSAPTPAPPSPTPAPPAPTPTGCPGGSLQACIGLCPSDPAAAYQACVKNCAARCS